MSLLSGVLGLGRAQAEGRFTETLTFFYEEEGEIPDGGIDPETVEVPVHAGVRGEVKSSSLMVSDRESAGQLVGVQELMVKVAVGATPDVREGHFCRVTASTVDPSLVGRKFRVAGWPQGGQTTSHRYPVEEA